MIAATLPPADGAGPTGPRLLTLREVAARLTLSPRSVRVLLARGLLPVVQLTTRRKAVAEADLQAWIDARRSPWTRPDAPRSTLR